jgi:hypothetical protein
LARNSDIESGGRVRGLLFVGACVAVFLVIAACAIYAVVRFAI